MYFRFQGYLPVIFITESIVDHLARSLNMNPCHVKEMNMYNEKDISYVVSECNGHVFITCNEGNMLWLLFFLV